MGRVKVGGGSVKRGRSEGREATLLQTPPLRRRYLTSFLSSSPSPDASHFVATSLAFSPLLLMASPSCESILDFFRSASRRATASSEARTAAAMLPSLSAVACSRLAATFAIAAAVSALRLACAAIIFLSDALSSFMSSSPPPSSSREAKSVSTSLPSGGLCSRNESPGTSQQTHSRDLL